MPESMIWITHPNVVGGSKVDLMGKTSTFDFNNLIDTKPIPGKDVASSYVNRLSETDYTGHQNPSWVIEGWFKSGLSTNSAGSVAINFNLLGSYCSIGSPCWFYDDAFILNPAGSACVFPQSFRVGRDVTREGRSYSLTLVETKEW